MLGLLKVLAYLVLGEGAALMLPLPLPGPVLGLVLMLADFALARGPDREVSDLFDAISPHLTLLFVPAGAQGLSIGVAAHAIGTARAFQLSETAGSFASLGMILNALLTTVLVALLVLLAGL